MPDDMFGEYVRENKKRIRPSSNALSGDFNREVHALQIGLLIYHQVSECRCQLITSEVITLRASRISMYRTTGATNYYGQSAKADSLVHVELFCKEMVDQRIFFKQDSRYKGRQQDSAMFYIDPDLYVLGAKATRTGEPLRKYQSKACYNWKAATSSCMDEDLDDRDGLDRFEFDEADDEMLEGDI